MYRSGKGSPHSHGTPVDVVPTTAGIPSTLNPLPRYYCEFQYRGNTANTATVSLFKLIHPWTGAMGTGVRSTVDSVPLAMRHRHSN